MPALDGFAVLVTGGGSGIGEGCAAALARDGASVTLCGRTQARLDAAAERLRAFAPASLVSTIPADVTVDADVRAAVDHAAREGGLHGVVHAAGGSLHMGPLHMSDPAAVKSTFELNMMGTFLTLKHSAEALAATRGSYVGISSHVAAQTERFLGAYSASKAGLEQLLRTAADELGASGIRVNSIRPGIIDNELMAAITAGGPVLDSYLAEIPLGRVGTVDDVAALARYLIGPESAWVTGQCIGVDGGQALRKGADYSPFAVPLFGEQPGWELVGRAQPGRDG
jgi:NAD(P)-dependent dehydrogenase (short-subunit alcohol dehydrogenase family)